MSLPELKRTQSSESSLKKLDAEKSPVEAVVDAYAVPEDDDDVDPTVIVRAEDVAVQVISARDDPSLPAVTFRSIFLGLGLSVFSAVLATIYTFKPQVSCTRRSWGIGC